MFLHNQLKIKNVAGEEVPARSVAKIDLGTYNETDRSVDVIKPDRHNLGYCRFVMVPDDIPPGKFGIAFTDGIRVVKKASGETITAGDKVATKKDDWFVQKDDYGPLYVIDTDGDYLYVRLCGMYPVVYVCGWMYGRANVWALDENGKLIWKFYIGPLLSGDPWWRIGLAPDDEGNVYVVALRNGLSFWKLNSCGEIVWALNNGGETMDVVVYDNFIYTYGRYSDSARGICKFDKDGGLKWKYSWSYAVVAKIALDPSGNVILVQYSGRCIKLDNDGNFIWEIDLHESITYWVGVATDSDGYIYISGQSTGGPTVATVWKLNPSDGSIVNGWPIATDTHPQAVTVDENDYIYVAGRLFDKELEDRNLLKINNSGAIIGGCRVGYSLYGVDVDRHGNIFVADNVGDADQIHKLNSSFVEKWTFTTGQNTHAVKVRYLDE